MTADNRNEKAAANGFVVDANQQRLSDAFGYQRNMPEVREYYYQQQQVDVARFSNMSPPGNNHPERIVVYVDEDDELVEDHQN